MGANLLGGEVVHVGVAALDQMLGPRVEALEMVGGEIEMAAPVEAEPAHVLHDRLDELVLLLGGVGVVEAHVAAPAELLRHTKIEADRLGVPYVQIAVGLGREARHHLVMPPGGQVGADHRPNEVVACAHALPLLSLRTVLSGSQPKCGITSLAKSSTEAIASAPVTPGMCIQQIISLGLTAAR